MRCLGQINCFCALMALAIPALADRPYVPIATVEHFLEVHDVRIDGSDRESREVIIRVDTAQGISEVGAQRIEYRDSVDAVESIEAWTIKPDGTKISVPSGEIRTQEEDSDGGSSDFSDTKYKVIVFPAVEVGGRVEFRVTIDHRIPPFPKFFDDMKVLSAQWNREHWEERINIPTDLPLYVEERGIGGGLESTKDGINHYHFTYHAMGAKAPESGSVWVGDFSPLLYISTYPDLIALGKAYDDAAVPMAQVTDSIRVKAEDITTGLTGNAAKVQALDHWVARNIRYVAVTLGHGGMIPHPAGQVLANRYGDCKDHAILMQAMLAAIGIQSTTAMVSSGRAYTLSTIGSIAPLDHAITYIPILNLYVDSTDSFSHVGTLSFDVMDKPTVLTGLGRLGRTPRMRADENGVRTLIEMKIRVDGTIEGHSKAAMTGTYESDSRANRFYAQSSPEEQVVKELLNRFNETGTGSLEHGDPMALDQPFWVNSAFVLDPVTNFPGPGALMIPVGLAPGGIAGVGAFKPLEQRQWPYICESRVLEDSYRIEFPNTAVLGTLPTGVTYEAVAIHYRSTYEKTGQSVRVHRILKTNRPGNVCTPQDNDEWKAFHAVLQKDLRAQVFYR